MEKSKKPKIRFKGFTDDWEQRKLGEVVEFYNGDRSSRYPNDTDMVSEGIPFINAGDLVLGRVKLDTANKITVEKYNELSGAKIQHGDIIYCLRGTLGKNAFVDNFSIGTVASSLVDIRSRKIVGKYLFQVLNSDIEYRQRTLNDEGAAQPNLSAKNLSLFNIPMPDEAEQTKIAEYFDTLDNLITLHQRKLGKLINVKKSMLEKMFPKQGSTVPEIRFSGFTNDWEQREFVEIFDCTIPNNTLSRSELSYDEGSILNVHYGDILIKYGSVLDAHKFEIPRVPNKKIEDFRGSLLRPGDIVIADTAEDETTGKACEIGSLFGNSIVAGLHTMVARPNIEIASGYLGYYLNSDAYHCQLLPMMQGIKVLSLSRANVKKTALKLPKSTKEQKLIANYFIQLDELITLHQCELEKLKNIKKSMLEKMFV